MKRNDEIFPLALRISFLNGVATQVMPLWNAYALGEFILLSINKVNYPLSSSTDSVAQ